MLLATEKGRVTDWPGYIGATVGLLILVALVYWLMRQGWNWRRTLQSDLPELPAAPEQPGDALLAGPGRYHGSTSAGNWLDRVVAHDLGTRSLAELTLTEQGLLARRPGAADLWIPSGALTGARTDSGIAGKVVPSGLLVVGWTHGKSELESGFRLDSAAEHDAWVEAVGALVTRTSTKKTEEAAT
ncbi:PH-like domain-containing protein [Kitasatospora griseola]|uniref:PH-like domain-containing protein n=1 Tax=Kitasatospora griseola TaxID=2064 RepID=UPI0037FAEAC5